MERMTRTGSPAAAIHLATEVDFAIPVFSGRLADSLSHEGFPARFHRVGSARFSTAWNRAFGKMPSLRQKGLAFWNGRLFSASFLRQLAADDWVVFYATLGGLCDTGPGNLLAKIKRTGANLLVLFQDAWPLAGDLHRRVFSECLRRADALAAVTPALKALVEDESGGRPVFLMEESVATDRFEPDFSRNEPVLAWCGPPYKLAEIERLVSVLESVFRQVPFRLRIASGSKAPALKADFPVEWVPYGEANFREQFSGASVGVVPYARGPYADCKGNYKVKTCMAAGCAVVTTPTGYNRSLVRPGETGLFAETDSDWEESLLRLLRDPACRLGMRKRARADAVSRFSPEAVASRYAAVFRSLGVSPRPGGRTGRPAVPVNRNAP